MREQLRYAVLGPIRAWRGQTEVDLGPPQQRAVLAALLLAEGKQVSSEELIDAVWGARAPVSAAGALRTYIYRLRKVLDPAGEKVPSVVQSISRGYRHHAGQDSVDFTVFKRMIARAEDAHNVGHLNEAAKLWREALGLWQGSALSGIRGGAVDAQRHRLNEQRVSAEAMLVRTEIELGWHAQAASALVGLVKDHPLDERFRELLMLAMYRSGRQAEALTTYQEARALLAEELGVDPGPGLQAMHQRVLLGDGDLLVASAAARMEPTNTPTRYCVSANPAQLPAKSPAFVGREAELKTASGMLTDGGCTLSVVSGMAGVGKTAFAIYWARQVAHSFPDGHIYLQLRGFDHGVPPIAPEQALRTALEALGADSGELPQDTDALAALLRSWLAGKRVLLLLDNARDAAQVRPLLPGAPGCLVIVTSRNRMAGLVAVDGAQSIHLDVLSKSEALCFVRRRLGGAKMATEPGAVADIVAISGHLPLALATATARAATRPSVPLAAVIPEPRDNTSCLDIFRSGDSVADIRTAFSCSYQALTPDAAELFRLLSLQTGRGLALAAVASLGGYTIPQTRHLLDELVQVSLVEERTPGKFNLHVLLKAYASELFQSIEAQGAHDADHLRVVNHSA